MIRSWWKRWRQRWRLWPLPPVALALVVERPFPDGACEHHFPHPDPMCVACGDA